MMNDAGTILELCKAIIRSTCEVVRNGREHAPVFLRDLKGTEADSYVLLQDATKLLCRTISAQRGEVPDHRWSPALPELLLAYPERCEEMFAWVENDSYRAVSHLHWALQAEAG